MPRKPPARLRPERHPIRTVIVTVIILALLGGMGWCTATLYRENQQLTAQNNRLAQQNSTLQQQTGALDLEMSDLRGQLQALQQGFQHEQEHPAYQDLYPDLYVEGAPAGKEQADTVFLTFDDGPSARTDEILSLLEQENIKATFFVVGPDTAARRERLKQIADAGHTIAVHSATHEYKRIYSSVEAYLKDFYTVWSMVKEATGEAPTIFRFPGGSINSYNAGIYQDIIAEMLRRGFLYYDWNVSSGDATSRPLPAETIAANVCGSIGKNGRYIVLMHDSTPRRTTVEALPAIIRNLKAKGYAFAPLSRNDLPITFGYLSPSPKA